MINDDKVIVMDIDGTLCKHKKENVDYSKIEPNHRIISKLTDYSSEGYYIILYTSRNMRTYQGNMGKINANTAKILFDWLEKYNIPYDEIHFGKPWCGFSGFYVDDRAIRPSEFLKYSYEEINKLLEENKII